MTELEKAISLIEEAGGIVMMYDETEEESRHEYLARLEAQEAKEKAELEQWQKERKEMDHRVHREHRGRGEESKSLWPLCFLKQAVNKRSKKGQCPVKSPSTTWS